MNRRIILSKTYTAGFFGTAHYALIDSVDGRQIACHHFPLPVKDGPLDTSDWYQAHRTIAQALADALNAAPNAAIERIIQAKRESTHVWDAAGHIAEKRNKELITNETVP